MKNLILTSVLVFAGIIVQAQSIIRIPIPIRTPCCRWKQPVSVTPSQLVYNVPATTKIYTSDMRSLSEFNGFYFKETIMPSGSKRRV